MAKRMAGLAALCLGLAAAGSLRAETTPLGAAVIRGDRAAVAELLARKADPNYPLGDTSTVLDWAVVHQDPDMVALLLAGGADPNRPDQDGMTPLLFACEYSDADIVSALIDAKADVTARRPDGISVLSLCARYSTPANLERMIAAGATVNAADMAGQTPLMWAAAGGALDNIALLLRHGAKVDAATRKGFTPLFFAIKAGSTKATQALLEAGADLNHVAADGSTAIMLALYRQDWTTGALLATRGAALDRWDLNGNQPLHVAAIAGQAEFARLLLAHGADLNAVTRPSMLNWKTEPNAGPSPVPKFVGMTPLFVAAAYGQAEVMKTLVAGGAKTDFRADDGANVVLAAAVGGSVAALDYAISLQPDLSVVNDQGLTAVHLVLQNRRATVAGHLSPETPEMVRLLAAKGAPLDVRSYRGRTPAEIARRDPPEVAKAFEDAAAARGLKLAEASPAARR